MAHHLEILECVGRMGAATSEQVQRLWYGERSAACRGLAKLSAAGLLDVHVGRLDEQNVYVLTRRGVELLVQRDVDESSLHRSKVTRGVDPHLRALNDLRVECVLAERDGRVDVRAFHGDLDLRRAAAGTRPNYIPDAIVELNVGEDEVLALFAEIDLGTESAATFAGKVKITVAAEDAEQSLWGFGPGAWLPVAFASTPGRVRALARSIVSANGGDLWLLAELSVLRERGIAGPIFAKPLDVVETPRGAPLPFHGQLPESASNANGRSNTVATARRSNGGTHG